MNEICFDDDSREEVSVILETIFIVVVSTLLSNVDVAVSIEVISGYDTVDDDEYAMKFDVFSTVLCAFKAVELEISFVVELN
jgi:hypothetical protein